MYFMYFDHRYFTGRKKADVQKWFKLKLYLFEGWHLHLSICLFFVQDGKMSHPEGHVLPDRCHPMNDAYSHCEVNV